MNNNHNPTKIKPLLTPHITIKSLLTYQDFLKKRPKRALTFRLSAKASNFESNKTKCKEMQAKLFKALEFAKPVRKIDLGDFTLVQDYFRRSKMRSALKTASNVKILYMYRMLGFQRKEIYIEKSLKNLKKVQYVRYRLMESSPEYWYQSLDNKTCKYPLKYLHYCLKLQKLLLSDPKRFYCFHFKKGYQRSQKMVMINNLLLQRPLAADSPIKFFREMISFAYWNYDFFHCRARKFYLNFIGQLPNLQEIYLKFEDSATEDLQNIFKKVAKKGTLKKVKLDFNSDVSNFFQILKDLKNCKLTSFSLKAFIKDDRALASLTKLLQDINQLEYLKLDISISSSKFFDNKLNHLSKICEQIKKFSQLQHLKLAFNATKATKNILKEKRLPNFFSEIYPIFEKPIKLKTLKISCNQIDHLEAFQDLIVAIRPLQLSLQKLTIDLGIPSRVTNSHSIAAALARNLANIQGLELPCLCLNTNLSLDLIGSAALKLKNLETLDIGEIDEKVDVEILLNTIKRILCKRGLRKLYCQLTDSLQKKLEREIKDFPQYNYGLRQMLKANPYLEAAHFGYDQVRSEVQKWFSTKPPLKFSSLLL